MMQFFISVDQLINTLAWARGEGFGMADRLARNQELRRRVRQ